MARYHLLFPSSSSSSPRGGGDEIVYNEHNNNAENDENDGDDEMDDHYDDHYDDDDHYDNHNMNDISGGCSIVSQEEEGGGGEVGEEEGAVVEDDSYHSYCDSGQGANTVDDWERDGRPSSSSTTSWRSFFVRRPQSRGRDVDDNVNMDDGYGNNNSNNDHTINYSSDTYRENHNNHFGPSSSSIRDSVVGYHPSSVGLRRRSPWVGQQEQQPQQQPQQRYHANHNIDNDNVDGPEPGEIVEYVRPPYRNYVTFNHQDEDNDDDDEDDDVMSALTFPSTTRTNIHQEQQQQQQQLSSSSRTNLQQQQQHHHHHYHINIPPDIAQQWMIQQQQQQLQDQQNQNTNDSTPPWTTTTTMTRRWILRTRSSVIWILFIIVCIVGWYGPSVPPPPPKVAMTTTTMTTVGIGLERAGAATAGQSHSSTPSTTTTTPSSSTTTTSSSLYWHEYWDHQKIILYNIMYQWIHLMSHVGYWCWIGIRHDLLSDGRFLGRYLPILFSHGNVNDNNDDGNTGDDDEDYDMLQFPHQWNLQNRQQQQYHHHNTVLFGQDQALQRMEERLNTWMTTRLVQRQKHRQPQHQQGGMTGPIIFYVTGGKGVGKKSLAYLLLDQMVVQALSSTFTTKWQLQQHLCGNPNDDSSMPLIDPPTTHGCPLLHLTSTDFDEYRHFVSSTTPTGGPTTLVSTSTLYQRIVDHVSTYQRGGSIVLMDHVDYPGTDGDGSSSWLIPLMKEIQSSSQSTTTIFDSTIIVMTSSVGMSTMEKWIRKQQSSLSSSSSQQQQEHSTITASSPPPPPPLLTAEIEALVRYDIQRFHSSMDEAVDSSSSLATTKDWVVVPTMALDRAAMTSILRNVALSSSSSLTTTTTMTILTVSDTAADRILDTLEWNQWVHKTTGQILRSWSPDGAYPLIQLWEDRIYGALSRNHCLDGNNKSLHDDIRERMDGGYGGPIITAQHILDLEEGYTSDLFVVKMCVLDDKRIDRTGGDEDLLVGSLETNLQNRPCRTPMTTTCRFYI